jgi:adenylosuccinate lyase
MEKLNCISPIDGRYYKYTSTLSKFFSEAGLIRFRIMIELGYFKAIIHKTQIQTHEILDITKLNSEMQTFLNEEINDDNIQQIKNIESEINHDVKAVEYFLKEHVSKYEHLKQHKEMIHFGLTSSDINSVAYTLMIKNSINLIIDNVLSNIIEKLSELSTNWQDITMLSFTHGQPATPTTMGKEINVFVSRLTKQYETKITYSTKFGGAVGNLSAHYAAYPDIDWNDFMNDFISKFGLVRQEFTTQIDNYDDMCAIFDKYRRINVILIDMCRDIWTYISKNYLIMKHNDAEVGSSTMPHKINPINFENAEGNLMMANNLFDFFSNKLPISRLQRDLTDSTVCRNIGVAFSHSLIAYNNILIGLDKIMPNIEVMQHDFNKNFIVASELIQTVMRKNGIDNAYEKIKEITRGTTISREELFDFARENLSAEDIKHIINILYHPCSTF